MKKGLLGLMLIFVAGIVEAQLPTEIKITKKTVDLFSKKELIVVLLEENENVLKKLSRKTDKLEYHKEAISSFNSNMQAMANDYLSVFKGIQFKTMTDISKMSQEDRVKYYYLVYIYAGFHSNYQLYQDDRFKLEFGIKIKSGKENLFAESYRHMDIVDSKSYYVKIEIHDSFMPKESNNSDRVLAMKNLPSIMPSKVNIIYALSSFKSMIDDAKSEAKVDGSILKEKTLVICEEDLDKKLPKSEIASLYSYKYKVVDRSEFNKIIEEKNNNFCSLLIVPVMQTNSGGLTGSVVSAAVSKSGISYANYVFDNESGRMAAMAMRMATVGGTGGGFDSVNDKSFKQFKSYIK